MILLMMLAGGLGAVARFLLDGIVRRRVPDSPGLGTGLINVTGSFVLGLFAGLIAANVVTPAWHAVVATGFFGGYTTFSTASFETVRTAQAGRLRQAVTQAVGTAVVSLTAAGMGYGLGLWL
jgi:CrcB protein